MRLLVTGGKGTADAIRRARRAGIPVKEIAPPIVVEPREF